MVAYFRFYVVERMCGHYKKNNMRKSPPEKLWLGEGTPLGLIEYIIEREYQFFLPFEMHKFGIFWNLHQPKGVPSPSFHQPKGFNEGCPPLAFINLYVLIRGALT